MWFQRAFASGVLNVFLSIHDWVLDRIYGRGFQGMRLVFVGRYPSVMQKLASLYIYIPIHWTLIVRNAPSVLAIILFTMHTYKATRRSLVTATELSAVSWRYYLVQGLCKVGPAKAPM